MHQFIKSLIAAGILFFSLITSVALSYAISPDHEETVKPLKVLEVKVNIANQEIMFNLNHTFTLLTPKVGK